MPNVIRIDDEQIWDHQGKVVRGSVEETLNSLFVAETERLCNAGRYELTKAVGIMNGRVYAVRANTLRHNMPLGT